MSEEWIHEVQEGWKWRGIAGLSGGSLHMVVTGSNKTSSARSERSSAGMLSEQGVERRMDCSGAG